MSRYDLIAFDMDGTLLTTGKKIVPETLVSIHRAVCLGRHVVLCTGRPVSELAFYMDDLTDVRYMVCESGSVIWDNKEKKILSQHTLGADTVQAIVNYIKDKDIIPDVMSGGRSYFGRDDIAALSSHEMNEYIGMFNACSVKVPDIYALIREKQDRLEKFNLFHTGVRERAKTRSVLGNLPAEIANSEISSLEFSPLHVNKGSGLRELADFLRVPMEHVIAVGDADNDLPMITAAGLGLAMGNSNAGVLDRADASLPDNNHNGCGWAIENFLLKN